MLRPLVIGLIGIGSCALFAASAHAQYIKDTAIQARALAEQSRLRLQPRVIAYHPETDSFEYQSSVATSSSRGRPGGDSIYYGSRLQRFRFLGPADQGGLYDAIQGYYESLDLNPRNYQYRMGRH